MSVNIRVRTEYRDLDFVKVLTSLATEGYKLAVKFVKTDLCEFFQDNLSTRPIDLSLEDNGYEVRITTLARKEDYELFARVVELVSEVTGGKVFYEDDDDEPMTEVAKYLNADWIEQQMKGDVDVLIAMALSKYENESDPDEMHEIGLYGPICPFYIGKNLLNDLGITMDTGWEEASDKLIRRFHYSQYSRPRDIRRTTTSMAINMGDDDKDEENSRKSLTYYEMNAFDMISRTNYFALSYKDKMLLLKYEDFMKVAPKKWERFDNCQYFTAPLTDWQFKEFWDRAKEYNMDSGASELERPEEIAEDTLNMMKAWIFCDVDYVRKNIKEDGLPPCAMHKSCKDGKLPIFYMIAKCQEINFDLSHYSDSYMPVVSAMQKRARAMVDFWEKEIGISVCKSISFNKYSNRIGIPDDEATIEDITGVESKDFRDAGFSNSDLLLYTAAKKFDFKSVKEILEQGVDPDLEFYPASNEDNVFCISEDIMREGYSAFQSLYAKFKWFLDTGEMVLQVSDYVDVISCAAHLQMYDFLKKNKKG